MTEIKDDDPRLDNTSGLMRELLRTALEKQVEPSIPKDDDD